MHSPFISDAEIAHVAHGVKDRSLPKPEWTHAAHFAAALYLLKHGEAAQMPALIRAYNEATGVPNTDTGGYHETITLASLRGAWAQLSISPDAPLHVTLEALMRSPLGRSDWLLAYWSRAVLFSPEARRVWTAPDLAPLPFPQLP